MPAQRWLQRWLAKGIVVHAIAERAVIDRLVDDLRRLGAVDHRVGGT